MTGAPPLTAGAAHFTLSELFVFPVSSGAEVGPGGAGAVFTVAGGEKGVSSSPNSARTRTRYSVPGSRPWVFEVRR